jgi:hypothetical protein
VSRGCPAAHPRRAPRSGSDAPAWPWPPWRKRDIKTTGKKWL